MTEDGDDVRSMISSFEMGKLRRLDRRALSSAVPISFSLSLTSEWKIYKPYPFLICADLVVSAYPKWFEAKPGSSSLLSPMRWLLDFQISRSVRVAHYRCLKSQFSRWTRCEASKILERSLSWPPSFRCPEPGAGMNGRERYRLDFAA